MKFSTGKNFLFVLHGNKMIQDDAKSIGLWRFSYEFVPYYDDPIILMFFKMTPHEIMEDNPNQARGRSNFDVIRF
jgi:hypothetical protein